MLKRNLAVLVLVGSLLGGGAFAWAQTSDGSPSAPTTSVPNEQQSPASRRAALQDCAKQAGVTDAKSATPEQRQQVKKCVQDKGIKGRPGQRAGILKRVVHGDLIVRGQNDQFQNVTYDRGKEDGVSGDKLTITRPDNHKVTVKLTKDTKYRGVENASQLQAGRQTLVVSKDGNALIVGQRAGNAKGDATPEG